MTKEKTHLNIGGPRGWTTACGIESSSFIDQHKIADYDEVDCKRCLKAMEAATVMLPLEAAKTLLALGQSYLRICKEVETDLTVEEATALDLLRDECRSADKASARRR
jgi:hypothetical protein